MVGSIFDAAAANFGIIHIISNNSLWLSFSLAMMASYFWQCSSPKGKVTKNTKKIIGVSRTNLHQYLKQQQQRMIKWIPLHPLPTLNEGKNNNNNHLKHSNLNQNSFSSAFRFLLGGAHSGVLLRPLIVH